MNKRGRRIVERAIIGFGVLAVSLALAVGYVRTYPMVLLPPLQDRSFAQALETRYGPERNSQHLEEWILRDFFADAKGGVFVDVGANHHQKRSNTYYLEHVLGWSGVAVDALPEFADGYTRNRPRTKFFALFVSDVADADATIYVPPDGEHLMASERRGFAESLEDNAAPLAVKTTTLDALLDRTGIPRIDFLTIDIELAEPKALAGFSIDRFRPRLVCIEGHFEVRQQILDYFDKHGYALVGKYLRVDPFNFWFAPLGTVRDEG